MKRVVPLQNAEQKIVFHLFYTLKMLEKKFNVKRGTLSFTKKLVQIFYQIENQFKSMHCWD